MFGFFQHPEVAMLKFQQGRVRTRHWTGTEHPRIAAADMEKIQGSTKEQCCEKIYCGSADPPLLLEVWWFPGVCKLCPLLRDMYPSYIIAHIHPNYIPDIIV